MLSIPSLATTMKDYQQTTAKAEIILPCKSNSLVNHTWMNQFSPYRVSSGKKTAKAGLMHCLLLKFLKVTILSHYKI